MKRFPKSRKIKPLFVAVVVVLLGTAGYAGVANWQNTRTTSRSVAATPEARNEMRRAALGQLSGALMQYVATAGTMPAGIPAQTTDICVNSGAICKSVHLVDLSALPSKGLLDSLPSDPVGGHVLYSSGYAIGRSADGTVTLFAPRAEKGATIMHKVQ